MKHLFNPDPVITSTYRFGVMARKMKETGNRDPVLLFNIRKESSMLLRRTIWLYLELRLPAGFIRILKKVARRHWPWERVEFEDEKKE